LVMRRSQVQALPGANLSSPFKISVPYLFALFASCTDRVLKSLVQNGREEPQPWEQDMIFDLH
jgi:hypothetical protein